MKYQAVIFDLDGTLVNTLADLAESVNQGLRKLSLPTHPPESFKLKIGHGTRRMVASCLPPDRQDYVEQLVEMQATYYAEHLVDCSHLYPGIVEMLALLRKAQLKLAVLSNKPDVLTQPLAQALFDSDTFDLVRGHQDGYPLKPDPASALALAAALNVAPAQVTYLGDSGVDMETARNAGFFPIGVTWGFRLPEELLQSGASAMLDHPAQLHQLLID